MTSVAYTRFLPDVQTSLTGCPIPTAINAIRNAAIDFCTKTNVWQETQDVEMVAATGLPMDLTGPTEAMVIQVLSCKVDGRLLEPVTIDYLDSRHHNWEEHTGTPLVYFQPNTAQLTLYPLPANAVPLRLRVAYAPTRVSNGLDSALYDNNLTTIAAGALAALMVIPEVPWSNAKLAMYYAAIYSFGVDEALSNTQKSFTRARNRVRSNPF